MSLPSAASPYPAEATNAARTPIAAHARRISSFTVFGVQMNAKSARRNGTSAIAL